MFPEYLCHKVFKYILYEISILGCRILFYKVYIWILYEVNMKCIVFA